MDNDVVIFTGCDSAYFESCLDLIASIREACGAMPRMRVLDVGLRPEQAAALAAMVEAVIQPGWDIGDGTGQPGWFRAMTARPCLPKYAADAAVVAWIDCDAWVQRWEPVARLVAAARDGRMAIVEERFGTGFTADLPAEPGTVRKYVVTAESAMANMCSCYRLCFGPEVLAAFGRLPPYNSGLFALRADSPSWQVWREILAGALAIGFHKLVEQQALTVGIRQGRIPVAPQPSEANYICGMGLPWYAEEQSAFTLPLDATRPLGVVHLTDTKDFPVLRIPHFPNGELRPMPLVYRDLRKYRDGGLAALQLSPDWQRLLSALPSGLARDPARPETWGKVSRNEQCPCGSGLRYKQCHGKLA